MSATIAELEAQVCANRNEIERLKQTCDLLTSSLIPILKGMDTRIERSVSNMKDNKVLSSFTLKQHATLQMLMLGYTNKEIADVLDVQESTAKVHLRSIMAKTNTKNRQEAVATYRQLTTGLDAEQYEMYTGLPKDWAIHPDQYTNHTNRLKESYHAKIGEAS